MTTERLAKWTVNLQYEALPDQVVQAAIRSFYNWLGCAIGGSSHPTTTITRRALEPFFGKPTSTILGHDGKDDQTDASHAALINGIASHVHDYDDTHLETIIHPTGPVASALLAQCEALDSVKSKDFILALVTGIEAECKIGLGVWPEHYNVGWHITSTTGSIGAAVAVGKVLKLHPEAMQHAIGIAATQVTGLREMFGSDTKSFHVGRAAQNGLMAATLASKGFTASSQSLDGKRGWTNVVSTSNSMDEHVSSLGQSWEILKNAFKPFPCGIVVHPAIDGCIEMHKEMEQEGLMISAIKNVHVRVHPLVLELTGKKTPQDGLQAKFSVYHGGAIGLVLGKAGPAQYENEVVRDRKIIAVRDRIIATADNMLRADEAEIVIELNDGKQLSRHVKHAIGSLEIPMNNAQLEAKFMDQVSLVLGQDGAEKSSKICWGLQSAGTITQFMQSLKPTKN